MAKTDVKSDGPKLYKPYLLAVWPGMGHVAISAGYYLMAKLDMEWLAELSSPELFDIDYIEVKGGVIQPSRMPRSRFFFWSDPQQQHDIVVFIGEAQPPLGKYLFCRRLIDFAREIGVERVFTCAAMATQMNPDDDARVFCAATKPELLQGVRNLETLEEGRISGLNGVLLAAAAEAGLEGTCLLGEMPHIFAQLPFPKASLAVLKAFTKITNVTVDFSELEEQAEEVGRKLGELLAQVEENLAQQARGAEESEDEYGLQALEEEQLSTADRQRIESLFAASRSDRSKAYELKQLLDQLGVFAEYEDRFLDLFKKPGGNGG